MEGERWGLGNKKGRGHSSGKRDNGECRSWIKKKKRERERKKAVKGAGMEVGRRVKRRESQRENKGRLRDMKKSGCTHLRGRCLEM